MVEALYLLGRIPSYLLLDMLDTRLLGYLMLSGMISTLPVLNMKTPGNTSTMIKKDLVLLTRVSTRLLAENLIMSMVTARVSSTKIDQTSFIWLLRLLYTSLV